MKNASPKKAPGCDFVIDEIKVVQRNQPQGNGQFSLGYGFSFSAPDGKAFTLPRPEPMTDDEKSDVNKALASAYKAAQEAIKAANDAYQAALEAATAPFLDRAYGFSSK